jgi:hypothetical protein
MKLILIFIFLLLFQNVAFSQADTQVVNKTKFVSIKTTKLNELGTKDTLLRLYRIEDGKRKYLLTHYLFSKEADSNNIFTDLGSMTIKEDSIIFVKHYLQTKENRDPIPEWRKQVYKVSKTGKLILVYDKNKKRDSEWINTNYNDDRKD